MANLKNLNKANDKTKPYQNNLKGNAQSLTFI